MTAPEEIVSSLKFGDISLAIRRLLDLAYETGNRDFLQDTILLSRNLGIKNTTVQEVHYEVERLLKKYAGDKKPGTPEGMVLVNAKGIAKQYSSGNFQLKPVDVELSTGEILGVVGENGHGKTTLLRCIAGQLALSSGQIHYPGLRSDDYYSIKNYVVFMPQRIPKWYGLLKDNLHFAAAISGNYGRDNELIVDFMIERLGLSQYRDLTWEEISSGYRTRFELARILLNLSLIHI